MLSLIFVTMMSFQSFANSDYFFKFDKKTQSCPTDAKLVANEFLKVEENGARVAAGKPACITKTSLKYIKAGRPIDYRGESGDKGRAVTKVKKGSMKIEELKLLSKEILEYEVKFSAVDSKTGKTLKDSFKFMASSLAKGNKRPSFGCGHMAEYPEKVYVSEDCVK